MKESKGKNHDIIEGWVLVFFIFMILSVLLNFPYMAHGLEQQEYPKEIAEEMFEEIWQEMDMSENETEKEYYKEQVMPVIIEDVKEQGSRIMEAYFLKFILTIPFVIYIFIVGFSYKRKFIGWAINTLWIIFVIGLFVRYYLNGSASYFQIPIYLIFPIIWTLYLKKSKRVKNTFTR